MECSTLDETDHTVLAVLTVLPGRVKEVPEGLWDAFGISLSDATDSLYELRLNETWVRCIEPGVYQVIWSCNCDYKRSAKRKYRIVKDRLRQPEFTVGADIDHDRFSIDGVETEGRRTKVRRLTSTPLRSRGGSEEPEADRSPTSGYKQLAGQTVSGRRIATDVVARARRRNTTLAWQDRPVEKWNATHLAGYFDAQTFTHLHGHSADRFVLKPVLAHFARMRREGITSEECKQMVDLFVQRELSEPDGTIIDSIWKKFIAQRGALRSLLTTNAGRRYNNQPSDDGGDEWT
jgi:hypothetical protein